jgi:hypothetical protein
MFCRKGYVDRGWRLTVDYYDYCAAGLFIKGFDGFRGELLDRVGWGWRGVRCRGERVAFGGVGTGLFM